MSNAWGSSFGVAWGVSWGSSPVAASNPGAGGVGRAQKRRWWQIEDKAYLATKAEIERVLDAYVRSEPVETEVRVKTVEPQRKPRPKAIKSVVKPEIPENWQAMYAAYMLQRDYEMARELEAALIRQDEDDVEVLLLLH